MTGRAVPSDRHEEARNRFDEAVMRRPAAKAAMAGGHTRNVVLTAAVLAQEQGRAIACPEIAGALRIEYRQLGRTVPSELLHSVAGAPR
jgi:hypothetical protein